MTITDFLYARLAEDEDTALTAAGGSMYQHGRWSLRPTSDGADVLTRGFYVILSDELPEVAAHVVRHHPDRVLAEVKVKRQILAEYEAAIRDDRDIVNDEWVSGQNQGAVNALKPVIHLLAAVYRDHPDYQKDWTP
ncbi:DUF6221 family protein [Allonocardiopsis opalescens]|uniref:Uncharacterized protein n=1 Tax=Allonocardiopsis opalescens TaxID=1144618 RepID=A0A2T0PT46_9ACTN|nr:DUF6221 family protein [Allonocardiopsis opalescens]PRX91968.1 hypothetical protein CLV72_11241 [Allonocardiopsis opalescens]